MSSLEGSGPDCVVNHRGCKRMLELIVAFHGLEAYAPTRTKILKKESLIPPKCQGFLGSQTKDKGPATGFSEGGDASEEFLGQRDNDALWVTDVAEPVFVLVLRHLVGRA